MTAWMIMGLLGLSMLMPIFDSDDDVAEEDDTPETPDTPDTPLDPLIPDAPTEVIDGTDGNDTLTAEQDQILNAGAGADTITIDGTNAIVNAGEGQDVITVGAGASTDAAAPAIFEANGEDGDDTITANGVGGTVNGGGGDDVISVQGTLDAVFGGGGDDTITGDSADYGGSTPLDGGLGNDLITSTDSPGFNLQSEMIGGAGDDTLISELADYASATSETIDVMTGGLGADVFEVTFFNSADPSAGATLGTVLEITDFNADDDQLVVDLSAFPVFDAQIDAPNDVSFEVADLTDGSGSELTFTITNADADGPLTGTILLSGVTGIDASAVTFVARAEAGDIIV